MDHHRSHLHPLAHSHRHTLPSGKVKVAQDYGHSFCSHPRPSPEDCIGINDTFSTFFEPFHRHEHFFCKWNPLISTFQPVHHERLLSFKLHNLSCDLIYSLWSLYKALWMSKLIWTINDRLVPAACNIYVWKGTFCEVKCIIHICKSSVRHGIYYIVTVFLQTHSHCMRTPASVSLTHVTEATCTPR